MTKMAKPVEQVLDRMELQVQLIIADTHLHWVVGIGNMRSVPVASFWTMSASMFSMFYHYDLIVDNLGSLPQLPGGDHRIDYIPGVSSIRFADLPDGFTPAYRSKMSKLLVAISKVQSAQNLLFRSINELEGSAITALNPKLPLPIYTVGPCIPCFNLDNTRNQPGYIEWLNSQPSKSVLYVSLGSVIPVSSEQMEELAAGLNDSGVHYLWVVRGENSKFKDACGEKGMIVSWCDQLKVLCHSSVGGFLTHCGLNSVLEGSFIGVPMLTFPLFMDQKPNSKLVVEDWKIGMRVRTDMENLVTREEITHIVKRFMDLDSDERKDLERRCGAVRDTSQTAVAGGSAEAGLEAFLSKILGSSKQ